MNEIIVVVRPEVYNIMLLEYAHAMYYPMFLKKRNKLHTYRHCPYFLPCTE